MFCAQGDLPAVRSPRGRLDTRGRGADRGRRLLHA